MQRAGTVPALNVRHHNISPSTESQSADRLLAAIEAKRAPVCVGIDPVADKLPDSVPGKMQLRDGNIDALVQFSMGVLDAVAAHVPCVKFQAACFERYRIASWAALTRLHNYAHEKGLEVILDAKRGDIGLTAEHYAASAFTPLNPSSKHVLADWLTINSYLGEDGITPFLKHHGHGAFALVRTSNPGGDAIQGLQLNDGRSVAEAVAEIIARLGSLFIGRRGMSSLGAVVGATKREDASRLREIMPQQMFLVPGYGAQGGGVDDVLPCFKSDGTGAIVTASRSVIYAFKQNDPKWMLAVEDAAAKFAEEIGRAVGLRK